MASPHAHHDSIVALLAGIDKGEKQQVVSAVDKILEMLLESKLAYRQTITPKPGGSPRGESQRIWFVAHRSPLTWC